MLTSFLLGTTLAVGQAAPPAPMPMPAPMTIPAAPAAPAPAAAPAGCTTCQTPAPAEEPEAEEKKFLLEKLLAGSPFGCVLADRGIKVQGWTQGNYTVSSARRSNAPITFNDRADFFQMNQNWLDVSKSVDTSKDEVQFGFRAGLILPGYDYKYTLARGFWNDQSGQYGFDAVYHYGEVFLPGIGPKGTTLRAGRWGTGIGYEVIDAVNTPFVSRSYNFQYNPFTHTGVQATNELSDNVTVYNGVVTGADVWIDPAATASYVGGIKWAPKDGTTSLAANVFYTGKGFNTAENFQHYNSFNLLFTQKLGDKLTYVLDSTYGYTDSTDPNGAAAGQSADWYGFTNYLLYQVNDCLASNLRFELFEDVRGARTGTRGLYTAATYGLSYTPIDSLIIRPFVRYDHNPNGPFEGKNNLYTGGIEAIVRW